jgi:O-antigen/teichoic acid export membrane protein
VLGAAEDLTRGRLLARNVALNAAGWAVPAGVAVLAIPVLVRGLGVERFGLLAFAWTLVGSFSPFDLGIGRALTQALAVRVGRGEQDDSPDVVWSTLWLLLAVGLVGAAGLWATAPALTGRWLHVAPAVRAEAAAGIRLLAVAVPLTVLTSGLRGVLEAGQAFRAVNALRVPLALFTFAGPCAALPFSRTLPTAVAVVVAGRLVVCALHAAQVVRRYPSLRRPRLPRWASLQGLAGVAGWMTLSSLSNPILVTGDRFLIGGALPIAALAQYAAVTEAASKLGLIGAVLQPVLLPALAATRAADPRRATRLLDRAARATALAAAPAAIVLAAFAPEVLRVWLGPALAPGAAPVLQVLVAAFYVNTCAQVPFVALQAGGRADLPAKFHAVEVPLYLGLLWVLASRYGTVGAAAACAIRLCADALALHLAVPGAWVGAASVRRRMLALAFGGGALVGACALGTSLGARAALAGVAGLVLTWASAQWLTTPDERRAARVWLSARRTRARGAAALTADGL